MSSGGGEIESDKLVESGTEKEERKEEEGKEEDDLIEKSHVVVKRRPKKGGGRSNRHQQVRGHKMNIRATDTYMTSTLKGGEEVEIFQNIETAV